MCISGGYATGMQLSALVANAMTRRCDTLLQVALDFNILAILCRLANGLASLLGAIRGSAKADRYVYVVNS